MLAESEDLSANGLFVRTEALLPVATTTRLSIALPTGIVVQVVARVAHLLGRSAAVALGRHPGMGLEIIEPDPSFHDALERFVETIRFDLVAPEAVQSTTSTRVLVVEGSEPLRERLTRALTNAGFVVDAQSDGRSALLACEQMRPDLVVTASALPLLSGAQLVRRLALHPALVNVPVVMIGEDNTDLGRLEAYRLGVREYIPKPFLDEELVIRLHRLMSQQQTAEVSASLRGALADVAVGTLLSLFEFERKSGLLLLMNDGDVARLFISEGAVIKVDAGTGGTPRDRLLSALDWATGQFEFTSCAVQGEDEIGIPTTHLLLEHARRSDESPR